MTLGLQAEHAEHDEAVASVVLVGRGNVDVDGLLAHLRELGREMGPQLYRVKGVLAKVGSDRKVIVQGVHGALEATEHTHSRWPREPEGDGDGDGAGHASERVCQVVLIGKVPCARPLQAPPMNSFLQMDLWQFAHGRRGREWFASTWVWCASKPCVQPRATWKQLRGCADVQLCGGCCACLLARTSGGGAPLWRKAAARRPRCPCVRCRPRCRDPTRTHLPTCTWATSLCVSSTGSVRGLPLAQVVVQAWGGCRGTHGTTMAVARHACGCWPCVGAHGTDTPLPPHHPLPRRRVALALLVAVVMSQPQEVMDSWALTWDPLGLCGEFSSPVLCPVACLSTTRHSSPAPTHACSPARAPACERASPVVHLRKHKPGLRCPCRPCVVVRLRCSLRTGRAAHAQVAGMESLNLGPVCGLVHTVCFRHCRRSWTPGPAAAARAAGAVAVGCIRAVPRRVAVDTQG